MLNEQQAKELKRIRETVEEPGDLDSRFTQDTYGCLDCGVDYAEYNREVPFMTKHLFWMKEGSTTVTRLN